MLLPTYPFPPPPSQDIFEFQVLLISQIEPFLVLKLDISWLLLLPGLDFILPYAPEVDEKNIADAEAETDNDRDLTRHISRCVFWSECLWADDVADTYGRFVSVFIGI